MVVWPGTEATLPTSNSNTHASEIELPDTEGVRPPEVPAELGTEAEVSETIVTVSPRGGNKIIAEASPKGSFIPTRQGVLSQPNANSSEPQKTLARGKCYTWDEQNLPAHCVFNQCSYPIDGKPRTWKTWQNHVSGVHSWNIVRGIEARSRAVKQGATGSRKESGLKPRVRLNAKCATERSAGETPTSPARAVKRAQRGARTVVTETGNGPYGSEGQSPGAEPGKPVLATMLDSAVPLLHASRSDTLTLEGCCVEPVLRRSQRLRK